MNDIELKHFMQEHDQELCQSRPNPEEVFRMFQCEDDRIAQILDF